MTTLEIRNVTVYRRDKEICRNISFSVAAGEVVALVGPNGAGKSTLLAAIAADLEVATGSITINGESVHDKPSLELARLRSVMPQKHDVVFPFRVREIVEMGLTPWLGTAKDTDENVDAALRDVDLLELAQQNVTTLSGGEMARTAFARTVLQDTPVMLFDEPTAALDIRFQERVLQRIRSIARSGRAVLMVVHDLEAAAAYADKIALIANGELIAFGTPREVLTNTALSSVYQHPVDVYVHAANGDIKIAPVRTLSTTGSKTTDTTPHQEKETS